MHGTYVAYLIGGVANNNSHSAGVAREADIASLKITHGGLGVTEDPYLRVSNAIQHCSQNGIDLINYSGHFTTDYDPTDTNFSNAMGDFDGLFVVAAGNSSTNYNLETSYPASHNLSNMIIVGCSDENDCLWEHSSYGDQVVDLFAPGTDIYLNQIDDDYTVRSGTSLSAPLVTGTLALMKTVNPLLPYSTLKGILLESCRECVNLYNLCSSHGVLDAYECLKRVIPVYNPVNGVMENLNEMPANGGFQWYRYYGSGVVRIETVGNLNTSIAVSSIPQSENITTEVSGSNNINNASLIYDLGSGSEIYIRIKNNSSFTDDYGLKISQIHGNNLHSYNHRYVWENLQKHKSYCECGASKLSNHVINGGINPLAIGPGLSTCSLCGGETYFGFVTNNGNNLRKIGYSSYIDDYNNIILGEYDLISYFRGLL